MSETTLVLVDERFRSLQWHISVEMEGRKHLLACGQKVDVDDVRDVELRATWGEIVPPVDGCGQCSGSLWHQDDLFGITDLAEDDELQVTYETPRSKYDPERTAKVGAIRPITDEHGAPTGTPEVVLAREDDPDLLLWPAWESVHSEAGGALGEIVDVQRTDRADDQARLATDGGQTVSETEGAEENEDGTPLPAQEACDCDRLCAPSWDYCPSCGRPLGDDDGHLATDGGTPAGDPAGKASEAGAGEGQDEITNHHAGEKTVYDHEADSYGTVEVVEVRCPTMDDARDVGAVVSLLNRHDAEEIREQVEPSGGEDDGE